jgi:serine/threonine protein kinase
VLDFSKEIGREIRALSNIMLSKHSNIVKLLGITHSPGVSGLFPVLVLEYADLGTMEAYFAKRSNDSEADPAVSQWKEEKAICRDIAAGLNAIHKCGIVHNDLNPRNILLFREGYEALTVVAKISDFGYSRLAVEDVVYPANVRWCAPEAYEPGANTDGFKSDIYAFGLVTWFLIVDRPDLFDNIDDEELRLDKSGTDVIRSAATSDCVRRHAMFFYSIVRDSLADDPERRILDLDNLTTFDNVFSEDSSFYRYDLQLATLSIAN